MKRKILGVVLVLALVVAALPPAGAPAALAAPSGDELAAVYKAYYDELKEATDAMGVLAQTLSTAAATL